ncbi:hypothetical protein Cgig2_008545 [Carnegiea gigantea]|uniref:Uncharacterized protein n=1 Tax=Carnegiea gigantea TaxID=171969 RepID=A0A9Q1JXQ5_9CARY|nr:hypothetical protein Cgig2_008545 [Carnegiea gigantea]
MSKAYRCCLHSAPLTAPQPQSRSHYTNCHIIFIKGIYLGSRLILSSKLSIEGPVRIREEYFEGVLEPPTVIEEAVTKQLRSAVGQAVGTIEQFPLPLRDVMSSGIRVPLGSTSSKGLAKGGRRLIRLVNSRSTPSNTIPSTSASPSPTPGTTSIPSRTSPLPNPDGSPFSSPRIQTPVFNSEQSPQLDVDAGRSISSTVQLENPPNLDSSTEVNSTRRGKTQIWPDGKGLFCSEFHGKVARKITEIYEGKYDVAYPLWWKIPQSVRDMWFNELKAREVCTKALRNSSNSINSSYI